MNVSFAAIGVEPVPSTRLCFPVPWYNSVSTGTSNLQAVRIHEERIEPQGQKLSNHLPGFTLKSHLVLLLDVTHSTTV